MSNASILAAVRAATSPDPSLGVSAPAAADPFPRTPCTGVGLVTSAYPGDSLLPSTANLITGVSLAPVADAGRDTVAEPVGGIQVHHQTLVFGGEQDASGYGPGGIEVLGNMDPVRARPDDHVVGTGADRRSGFATASSSACEVFGDADGDRDDGMMRISGGTRA